MNTPTPEQIAKVARHVGYVDVSVVADFDETQSAHVFVCGRLFRPFDDPYDCMDLQRRVRAMSNGRLGVSYSTETVDGEPVCVCNLRDRSRRGLRLRAR